MSLENTEEILQLCDEFIPGNLPEYFFDRNPENFPSVLEMYRSGKFHIPAAAKCKLVDSWLFSPLKKRTFRSAKISL